MTDRILAVAELIRPKLIRDGLYLLGFDIVGDNPRETACAKRTGTGP